MTEPNYLSRLWDERVRGYLLLWAGSVAVVCGWLLLRGEHPLAAVVTFVLAAVGLVFQRTSMPGFFVVAVGYFLLFPGGLPDQYANTYQSPLSRSSFRIADLLVVSAVICYLSAQFRLYTMTFRAIPDDRPAYLKRTGEPPVRTEPVGDGEFPGLFAGVAAVVVIGQLVWFVTTNLEPTFDGFPGFRPGSWLTPARQQSFARFVVLGTVAFLVVPALGVGFWYWRLSRLPPDEARLLLLDTGWRESRRELARIETWRLPRPPRQRLGVRGVFRGIRLALMLGFVVTAFTFFLVMVVLYLLR